MYEPCAFFFRVICFDSSWNQMIHVTFASGQAVILVPRRLDCAHTACLSCDVCTLSGCTYIQQSELVPRSSTQRFLEPSLIPRTSDCKQSQFTVLPIVSVRCFPILSPVARPPSPFRLPSLNICLPDRARGIASGKASE